MPGEVLVLGSYRQSLAVLRALARSGRRLSLGVDAGEVAVAWSRHVDDVVPGLEHDHADFADRLACVVGDRVVFPVGENELLAVARARPRLGDSPLAMPRDEVLGTCLDKGSTLALARAVQVPAPPTVHVRSGAEVAAAVRELGLPVMVKRPSSDRLLLDRKAVRLEDPVTARLRLDRLSRVRGRLLVQRLEPGRRHNLHFGAWHGEVLALFAQEVVRTDRADGTGFGVAGVSIGVEPGVGRQVRALVEALDYTGVGCVQLLVDRPTGRTRLLEINPRLDATCALPLALGIDFPGFAVACAEREAGRVATLPPVPEHYPPGRRYHWLLGELLGLAQERRRGVLGLPRLASAVTRAVTSSLAADHHLTFDPRDPLPTAGMYLHAGQAALRRLRGIAPARRPEPPRLTVTVAEEALPLDPPALRADLVRPGPELEA